MADPSGSVSAMHASDARCKLWTRLLARWLELEDAEDTNALLAMPGVHWCLRLCCAVAAARAIGATSRAAVARHGLNDLSRGGGPSIHATSPRATASGWLRHVSIPRQSRTRGVAHTPVKTTIRALGTCKCMIEQ